MIQCFDVGWRFDSRVLKQFVVVSAKYGYTEDARSLETRRKKT